MREEIICNKDYYDEWYIKYVTFEDGGDWVHIVTNIDVDLGDLDNELHVIDSIGLNGLDLGYLEDDPDDQFPSADSSTMEMKTTVWL